MVEGLWISLLCRFAELAEVCDDLFVVEAGVDVEARPKVAEDDGTAEAVVGEQRECIAVDAAGSHHLAVDESCARGIVQLHWGVGGVAVGVGDAVEDGGEEHVVKVAPLLQFFQRVAGAAAGAVVVLRQVVVFLGEVNAAEVELIDEVEMVVHHDAVVPLLRDEREQAFGVYRFGVGLAQMEQVKSFLEKG